MASYVFKDSSGSVQARESLTQGTDGSGNTIHRNVVAVEPGSGTIPVALQNETGLATDSTLSNVDTAQGSQGDTSVTDHTVSATQIALMKGVIELLGGTLTVTDDGSLDISSLPNVTIGSENADLASETTLSAVDTFLNNIEHSGGGSIDVVLQSVLEAAEDSIEVGAESVDMSKNAYRSEPDSFDPSQGTQQPQCDAFMVPSGTNDTVTLEYKATSGGSLSVNTVPTNQILPQAVYSTGTSGTATSFLGFNL